MKNWKLNKYLKQIIQPIESDDFLYLFSKTSVLGYSDSVLGSEDYLILKTILQTMIQNIESNNQYKELLSTDDGYLIPYKNTWLRLNMVNQKPVGLTYYLDSTFKLFLFEHEQKVSVSNVSTSYIRGASFVTENLQLA